jgi:hypothetical protein
MKDLAPDRQDSTISRSQLVYVRLKELIRRRILVPASGSGRPRSPT